MKFEYEKLRFLTKFFADEKFDELCFCWGGNTFGIASIFGGGGEKTEKYLYNFLNARKSFTRLSVYIILVTSFEACQI